MRLALRMGRTLAELRQSLSASEAMLWAEFDRLSPVGDERGDILTAQIVQAVFGSQGVKLPLDEAVLRWGADDGKQDADPFATLEEALSLAAQ